MPTVLITGTNRGVGLPLAQAYSQRGYRVISAVRDVSTAPKLDNHIVLKLDASSLTDARDAVEELRTKHDVSRLDLVIANAAVNVSQATFARTDLDDLRKTWEINVRGPLVLYQAVLPLLDEKTSKFVVMSSGSGTIGQTHGKDKGEAPYGQSKAALNYFIAKANAEHDDLVIVGLNPGWLQTDMGNQGARWGGMKEAPTKVEENIPGMLKVIDEATKGTSAGKMMNFDGQTMAW